MAGILNSLQRELKSILYYIIDYLFAIISMVLVRVPVSFTSFIFLPKYLSGLVLISKYLSGLVLIFLQCLDKKNSLLKEILEKDQYYKNSIIYIEDPTGKTRYEENKSFRENIVRVINHLSSIDSYLVVTTRENIYQKTLYDMGGESEELQVYVTRLEIGSPSYDSKLRKDILLRWANKMKCSWLEVTESRDLVLTEIETEMLPKLTI